LSQVDVTHAAGADLLQDLVVGEGLADHEASRAAILSAQDRRFNRGGGTGTREGVSKTSPKLRRIPEDSGGLKRTQHRGEGLGVEPLTDENRAPSISRENGLAVSPLRHQALSFVGRIV
jgi:hypothetical protein